MPLIIKYLEFACLVSSELDMPCKARLGHALSIKRVPSCMLHAHNHLVIHEPGHES